MDRHQLLVVIVGAILLSAGCFSGTPQETQSPSLNSTDSPTMTPGKTDATTDTLDHSNDSTTCPEFISFGEIHQMDGWEPGIVRISYTVLSKTDILFAVYENETIIGTERKSYSDDFSMDGWPVQLTEPLDGPHTIRVLAYTDTNRDGSIDSATDEPCQRNGSVIQAGPTTFEFNSSQNGSTRPTMIDSTT